MDFKIAAAVAIGLLAYLAYAVMRPENSSGASARMDRYDYIQIILYVAVLILLTPLLGTFMARVLDDDRNPLKPVLGWLETLTYRACGVFVEEKMNWKEYTFALLTFNFFGFAIVFALQMLQPWLPLNPQHLSAVSWHSSLNTAVSFMTNTNWQGYAGETTMSYLTQMLGLTVQNFVSAATGIAVFVALTRGIREKKVDSIGNFWVDLTRSTIYILLPMAFVVAIALMHQGVVQNLSPYANVTTLEGAQQTIPMGPAASQIAIKQIGTNGGGFFNANSAHPFESVTPFTNFIQMLAILLIPAALVYTYGVMVKARRHGWLIFAVMMGMFLLGLAGSIASEYTTNPIFGHAALMEGKETRFGVVNSLIWSTATTDASNGSVNAMHSSLSPLAGGIAMFNIMLGEVIFGGVGAGMYGMLVFVLLTVFLAGLMVGRTPEYLGKKLEAAEMKWVVLAILAPAAAILLGAGISAVLPTALASLANAGPHGLSEILYAFSSAAGNNGSAFAGLNANTPYYNVTLAIAMLVGRFAIIIPVLAVAGYLGRKNISPPSAGTFATDTPVFAVLLLGVIIIVGALTFMPALCLGPLAEHFLMLSGRTF